MRHLAAWRRLVSPRLAEVPNRRDIARSMAASRQLRLVLAGSKLAPDPRGRGGALRRACRTDRQVAQELARHATLASLCSLLVQTRRQKQVVKRPKSSAEMAKTMRPLMKLRPAVIACPGASQPPICCLKTRDFRQIPAARRVTRRSAASVAVLLCRSRRDRARIFCSCASCPASALSSSATPPLPVVADDRQIREGAIHCAHGADRQRAAPVMLSLAARDRRVARTGRGTLDPRRLDHRGQRLLDDPRRPSKPGTAELQRRPAMRSTTLPARVRR